MHAVLTGDIVNSTRLPSKVEAELMALLKKEFSHYKFEIFRGDSFQVYIPDVSESLRTALRSRIGTIKLSPSNPDIACDLRISIGIGKVVEPVRDLATAKGEAFILSGRGLDEMGKSGGKIGIITENKLPGIALALLADYINSVVGQVTQKQAEVIYELLAGLSQQQVAEKLDKSKSTISQHAAAGKWEELEKILLYYQQITQLISL